VGFSSALAPGSVALDDRGTIHAAWKRAERPTALTSEPGQAEGVGDLARRAANEGRRLEAERERH
jgi:hypothetical protein